MNYVFASNGTHPIVELRRRIDAAIDALKDAAQRVHSAEICNYDVSAVKNSIAYRHTEIHRQ